MVKVDIEMPKDCKSCPMFREHKDVISGEWGECMILEIKDLNDDVVAHQTVNAYYVESAAWAQDVGRSKHCPLKEVK